MGAQIGTRGMNKCRTIPTFQLLRDPHPPLGIGGVAVPRATYLDRSLPDDLPGPAGSSHWTCSRRRRSSSGAGLTRRRGSRELGFRVGGCNLVLKIVSSMTPQMAEGTWHYCEIVLALLGRNKEKRQRTRTGRGPHDKVQIHGRGRRDAGVARAAGTAGAVHVAGKCSGQGSGQRAKVAGPPLIPLLPGCMEHLPGLRADGRRRVALDGADHRAARRGAARVFHKVRRWVHGGRLVQLFNDCLGAHFVQTLASGWWQTTARFGRPQIQHFGRDIADKSPSAWRNPGGGVRPVQELFCDRYPGVPDDVSSWRFDVDQLKQTGGAEGAAAAGGGRPAGRPAAAAGGWPAGKPAGQKREEERPASQAPATKKNRGPAAAAQIDGKMPHRPNMTEIYDLLLCLPVCGQESSQGVPCGRRTERHGGKSHH
eukprot:gene6380-biopygen11874